MVARAVVAASSLIRQRRAVVLAASVVVLATGFTSSWRSAAMRISLALTRSAVFSMRVELAPPRVLDGQVPYRDFSLIYAPGQAYVLAAVFWPLGSRCPSHGRTIW